MLYRIVVIFFLGILCGCGNENRSDTSAQNNDSTVVKLDVPEKVNYNEHIATIIYTKCASCHRPGESGPFSLLNYKEVYRRKKTIVKVTHNGYMHPWPADRGYSSFVGELYLTDLERH